MTAFPGREVRVSSWAEPSAILHGQDIVQRRTEEGEYAGNDGAIWCLHAGVLRDINRELNPGGASLNGIAWVYDTKLLETSFEGLTELDGVGPDSQLLLLWEPRSLDARIANQSGLLSITNGCTRSQHSFFETHCAAHPDLLIRIIISASMKSEARDMLDQNNISERTMYPGLPGLCSWLKRYYSAAWQSS